MADYLPPVVAKLTGDDGNLTTVLARAKEKVRRFAADVGRTQATINVDAKLRDGSLAEIRRRVNDGPAARMKVDLQLGAGQQDEIRQRLSERAIMVQVKPVMDSLALRRVQTVLTELGKPIRVSIRPAVDDAAQRRSEDRLTRLSRDRTVVVRTRVIGGGNAAGGAAGDVGALSALISLAPALVPVAAYATSVAVSMAAATLAVGAFGLAVIPQIKQLGEAATSQQKYTDAVSKYGPKSTQAAQAQDHMYETMTALPPATRRAAAGFLLLKDDFKSWSNGLSSFTMAPVQRSFAVFDQLLPKFSPMVKGASGELSRLIAVAGGGVTSTGFDAFADRVSAFANDTLHNATNDIIHFSRVLSEGKADGPVSSFMQYARQEGPQVRETLTNIARAVSQILKGASDAGPGMLSLVNAVARLVAALPPQFIGTAMQVYTAFKLIGLANHGVTAMGGSLTNLSGQLTTLRAAAVNAGGGLAGARAAIASISTGTKVAGAVAVVAGLALVFKHFSDESKKAKISSDDMSTSLKGLSAGGTATATIEQLTKDAGNLHQSLMQRLNSNDSVWDIVTNSGSKTSSAKKDFAEVGTALADMVKAGESDQAAIALKKLTDAGVKIPTKNLEDYKNALADTAFESKMTADSMGLFGDQAVQVQKKLDAQKKSAQGLQQAILDLNDANRQGMDAESDYQQAIADTTAGIAKHEHSLKMSNGQLNLQSQAARDSYGLLSKLAATTEANSVATLQQTGSQDKANRKLIEGHDQLVRFAEKLGLVTADAKRFADQLDNIHDPKIMVTVYKDQAEANIAAAEKKLAGLPRLTTTALRVDAAQLNNVIRDAKARLAALNGKTATVYIRSTYIGGGQGASPGNVYHEGGQYSAYGGVIRPRAFAGGGTVPGYAPLRDVVPAVLSPGEGVLIPEAVRRLGGSAGVNSINRQSRAGGSMTGAFGVGGNVPAGLAAGMSAGSQAVVAEAEAMARAAIGAFSTEMGIASPSKKFRALGGYVVSGLVQGLTGSTASVKAAVKRISATLYVDFGSSHKALQQYIARDGTLMVRMANQRDSVANKLKAAQSKLAALGKAWSAERDSVASGIMQNASIITASPDPGRNVNAADVLAQMRQKVAQAKAFAEELDQLRKKGLRSDLIQQLAAAGVDQAGGTVLALAGGSSGQIAEMNKLQSNLSTAANATGSAVASAMYGAGIKSAQGLVKGLQSQEKAIEKQMMRIALSMQAAIKRALGIRSPSSVMATLGDHTARGMAVGINRSAKHAVIAARGMAMSVRQGAVLGGGPIGGGGMVVHQHLTVNVEGSVMSDQKLVSVVEKGFLKLGARNPMTYQPYKR